MEILFYLVFLQQYLQVNSSPLLEISDIWQNNNKNDSVAESSRLARVLNFFPVPVEEECLSNDNRRKGVCMNAYECRIQSGSSHGPCALGFGVCCVFTATCQQQAFNNITYFVNPDFPDLSRDMSVCSLEIKKIDPEISQLRLDFIHFNLGQPNRRTGVCEEDVFILSNGRQGENLRELKICGLNNDQHVYFDVEDVEETITITMNLSKRIVSRLWEIRVIQVPFIQRAPSGCLQYHTGPTGVIQTMNFADNGRHLADQDYTICMRQEGGMCSIAYEPCDENSFKIAPNLDNSTNPEPSIVGDIEEGSGDAGLQSARQIESNCNDRIVLPCDSDDLLMMDNLEPGSCNVVHCGKSFCPQNEGLCRVESSAKPFTVGVHFGPSAREELPDDNLGMCLIYEQLPCDF